MLHEGRIIAQGTAAELDQQRQRAGPRVHGVAALGLICQTARLAAVGAFVVGGVLLFAVGLFLIGNRRMLFSDTFEVYAEFAQIAALDGGAKVRVSGMDAGEVQCDSTCRPARQESSGCRCASRAICIR